MVRRFVGYPLGLSALLTAAFSILLRDSNRRGIGF
jgi:hypothetical protein